MEIVPSICVLEKSNVGAICTLHVKALTNVEVCDFLKKTPHGNTNQK